MIGATDITWDLAPPAKRELVSSPAADGCDALDILAHSEAHLLDQATDLTAERDRYRELAQQALHALHAVTMERDVLREQRRLDLQRRRMS